MDITVTALYERLQNTSKIAWIDVRSLNDFFDKRPDSPFIKNLPLDQLNTLDLPKDQHLFVSCLSGRRSQAAKDILIARGYTHVFNVTGGYLAWQEAGFPVTKK
ncbi:MAG: rhodanese-like domain-containing protein [Magnetovibrio sp.]|nr:rhodanese-like domain-containing protein [Magnetovibrio sp.]